MKNLVALFVAALSISAVSAPAVAQTSNVTVQYPCQVEIPVDACVFVSKTVKENAAPTDVTFSTAAATQVLTKAKRVAVIYELKAAPGRNATGVSLNRGNQRMISDLSSTKPTYFWVFSMNGGQSWSKIFTTNPEKVIDSRW